MDRDYSHYELAHDLGKTKIFTKKPEFVPNELEIKENLTNACLNIYDNLSPEKKLYLFDKHGCQALIDGVWTVVDREYYLNALGLS